MQGLSAGVLSEPEVNIELPEETVPMVKADANSDGHAGGSTSWCQDVPRKRLLGIRGAMEHHKFISISKLPAFSLLLKAPEATLRLPPQGLWPPLPPRYVISERRENGGHLPDGLGEPGRGSCWRQQCQRRLSCPGKAKAPRFIAGQFLEY